MDSPSCLGVMIPWICLGDPPTHLDHHDRRVAGLSLLRHPIAQTRVDWCRNVRLLSIAYAFRPRLRVRLTLSGLTFLRKPWVFGERVSHPFSRYSFRHNHFCVVDPTLPVELHPTAERSPTNPVLRRNSIASALDLSPVYYRRGTP
jgi:hypothetical protein